MDIILKFPIEINFKREGQLMSKNSIYHGFCVYGNKYFFKTEYREGELFIHIKKRPEYQYCVDCESRNAARKGHVERERKTLPIGKKNVYMALLSARFFSRLFQNMREKSPCQASSLYFTIF